MTPIERVSRTDALFLNVETDSVQIQVALAFVVEGRVDFEQYVEWFAPRVSSLPRLLHVLRPEPFNLRFPAWIPDTAFDVRNHLFSAHLDAPNTQERLEKLLTDLYRQPLPRNHPLWRIYVVNGLKGDRSVLLFCMHHCVADGTGSTEMFKVFFETPRGGWPPYPPATSNGAKRPIKWWPPIRAVRALVTRKGRAQTSMMLRYMMAPSPWLPFLTPVSGKTHYSWWLIPQDDLRALSTRFGGTVTDVVVTIMAAGVERYARVNEVPVKGQFFRIQLAANIRPPENYGKLGNELAVIPVLVPFGFDDPLERLKHVVAYTRKAKKLDMANFMHGAFDGLLAMLTPPGQALVGKILASSWFLWLNKRITKYPRDHTLTTSVSMPSIIHRVQGHDVSALMPFIPCSLDVGLANAAITYRNQLQFTLAADVACVPNIEGLMDHMKAAFEELKEACELPIEATLKELVR